MKDEARTNQPSGHQNVDPRHQPAGTVRKDVVNHKREEQREKAKRKAASSGQDGERSK